MKLYYTKGACSLVVRIIINELNLNADFESVNLSTKKTASGQNFLGINQKGAVPVLEINPKEILTENAVILQYLADTTKATQLLPAIGDFNRYRVLEWLNYVATDLHKGIGILFNPAVTSELREQLFIPLLKSKLTFVNNHLQDNRYLAGESFTLPDAYLFVMLLWASYFNLDLKEWGHLARYFEELKSRLSIKKALEQEG
ncbi:MAG: glutathione transferase GstA [Legionellales bacterium RIFCSPHIGHO2_12_FULL_35_11]|nr:MAG: glutathione transferase GstA [Legionellales bacterium RIFCSPHIGHO2_12_FULL_35_11]